MLCGTPASTRERSFSERGREMAILSQVRSPTSWLWVNSRWACQRSLCGGSSSSWPGRGAPSAPVREEGERLLPPVPREQRTGLWVRRPDLTTESQGHLSNHLPWHPKQPAQTLRFHPQTRSARLPPPHPPTQVLRLLRFRAQAEPRLSRPSDYGPSPSHHLSSGLERQPPQRPPSPALPP